MLFISCKLVDGNKFVETDSPSNQVFFCSYEPTKENPNEIKEIGSLNFMRSCRDGEYKQMIFYIHGFNNQPEDALYQGAVLQKLYDMYKPKECLVIPIIWPCHNKVGVLRDYWDDQKSADMSGFAIGRAISLFVQWQQQNKTENVPCFKYMNILAHSMGNRVLKEAMYHWGHYDSFKKVPMIFRNIFMVAADVTERTLEPNQKGSYIPYAGKNVVVYYAGDDRALQGSKLVNMENRVITKRLGHGGPTSASMVQNVYGVNCDPVNSKYDILGHSYFYNMEKLKDIDFSKITKDCAGKVFEHIFSCINTGEVKGEQKQKITTNSIFNFWR